MHSVRQESDLPADADGVPSRRFLLDTAIDRLQDVSAEWDRLTPRQRRAACIAAADFLADLRAAGVIR